MQNVPKVHLPKWTDSNVSVRYLSIKEVNKRRKLLKQMRECLKHNLSAKVYQEVSSELGELFLGGF
jgi:hypothetical protein